MGGGVSLPLFNHYSLRGDQKLSHITLWGFRGSWGTRLLRKIIKVASFCTYVFRIYSLLKCYYMSVYNFLLDSSCPNFHFLSNFKISKFSCFEVSNWLFLVKPHQNHFSRPMAEQTSFQMYFLKPPVIGLPQNCSIWAIFLLLGSKPSCSFPSILIAKY